MREGIMVRLVAVENFRLTDRNKAGGDGIFDRDGHLIKAELIYYLQGSKCLNIRLGRHDPAVKTSELESYLTSNQTIMRQMAGVEAEKLKKEKQAKLKPEPPPEANR
jgi:hypothetical protein